MFGLLSDVARIALAPVRIAAPVIGTAAAVVDTVTRPITQPLADVAEDVSKSIADALSGK